MTVHVVFGAGPVGRATARHLVQQGHRVRIVSRSGLGNSLDGVEHVRANLNRIDSVECILRGAAVAYQCAQPPYHRWPQEFPELQSTILNAAEKNNVPIVIADNLYMYGPVHGVLHENLPAIATTRKGCVRARMAKEALDRDAARRVRIAIVRAADFFGADVKNSAVGHRFVNRAVAGRAAQIIGHGDQPHSVTYIEDFGRALALLGRDERGFGGIWHVPNAPPITLDAFADLVFSAAGKPKRVSRVSKTSLCLAGILVPPAREMVEMYYQFDRPFIVGDHKLRATFGFIHTPIEEAVVRTVAALKRGVSCES
jgi:nucleoside-diphosphate-sugar epimerase